MSPARKLALAGAIPALVSVVLAAAGFHFLAEFDRGTRQLTLSQAANQSLAPAGSYVVITGTADPENVGFVAGEGGNDFLLALRGEPRLVLHCPGADDCGEVVRRYRPDPSTTREVGLGAFVTPRAFAGRVYDGGEYQGYAGETRALALGVAELATRLGLPSVKNVRVVHLGETLSGLRMRAWFAFGFAALFALGAGVWWALIAKGVLPRPPPVRGVLLP